MVHPAQESFFKRYFGWCCCYSNDEVEKVNNEKIEKMAAEAFAGKIGMARLRIDAIKRHEDTPRRHRRLDSTELISVRTAFNWNPERLPRPKPDDERSKSH